MAYGNPVTINLWETAFPTYTKNGGFEKMKLKKVLCMAVLSAAVALTGVPQGMATLVHAEETQIAGLDEVLRQMYALYQSGDYNAMYTLDINAGSYAEAVRSSGADRYVVDLDGNTKVMMFVSNDGGYWWYFGQMENNLRQGNGTTFLFESEEQYSMFTGTYAADYPSGNGTYTFHCFSGERSGEEYDISGNFQGIYLNGAYQVNTHWIEDGTPISASLLTIYSNNHFQSIDDTEWMNDYYDDYGDDGKKYSFCLNASDYNMYFSVSSSDELFTVGLATPEYGTGFCKSTEELNNGLYIFRGNSEASVAAPAPSAVPTPNVSVPAPAPEALTPAPEPAPVVTANTYVVQRGDNLSKIAQKVYGDKKYWKNIYEANKATIKKDYTIWANQVLTIPAL